MLGGSSSPLDRLPPIYQVSPSSASTGQPYIKHEYGDSARGEVFIEEAERSRRMSQRTSKPKHEDLSHSVVQDANGQYRHLTEKEIKRMRRCGACLSSTHNLCRHPLSRSAQHKIILLSAVMYILMSSSTGIVKRTHNLDSSA